MDALVVDKSFRFHAILFVKSVLSLLTVLIVIRRLKTDITLIIDVVIQLRFLLGRNVPLGLILVLDRKSIWVVLLGCLHLLLFGLCFDPFLRLAFFFSFGLFLSLRFGALFHLQIVENVAFS